MSQRSKRRRGPHRGNGERAAPTGQAREETGGGRPVPSAAHRGPSGWGLGVQLAFLVAVFAVVVLVAELAGAANLGVALGVGQIAFAIAVIYLLLRR